MKIDTNRLLNSTIRSLNAQFSIEFYVQLYKQIIHQLEITLTYYLHIFSTLREEKNKSLIFDLFPTYLYNYYVTLRTEEKKYRVICNNERICY